ncbi:MAG: SRPBCC family protein [Planctomycetota bacterium]
MPEISYTTIVDAPLERLWERVRARLDVQHDLELPGASVEILEHGPRGAKRRVSIPEGNFLEILELDPDRRELRLEIRNHPLRNGAIVYRVRPLEDAAERGILSVRVSWRDEEGEPWLDDCEGFARRVATRIRGESEGKEGEAAQ